MRKDSRADKLRKVFVVLFVSLFTLTSLPNISFATQSFDPVSVYARNSQFTPGYSQADPINGSFTHAVNITAPPGRAGLEPNLSLGYSSQNTSNSSLYGYGWSDNIPYIERINKTGMEDLYATSTFSSSLSGELVQATSGVLSFFRKAYPKEYVQLGAFGQRKANGDLILYAPEELQDKRTKTSKTYLKGFTSDNKQILSTRVYAGDIHYFDPQSRIWEDIDTTPIRTRAGDWEMNYASYRAKLSKDSKNFLTYTNKNQELTFSLADSFLPPQAGEKQPNKHGVEYQNTFGPGIDLEIDLRDSSIRKDIIIKNRGALSHLNKVGEYYEIPFLLTSKNDFTLQSNNEVLKTTLTTTNITAIIDAQGQTSYIWPAYAIDSGKTPDPSHTQSISIRYEKTPNGVKLTKLLPADWLESATTTYPVRTDAIISPYSGAGDGEIISLEDLSWSNRRNSSTGNSNDTIAYVSVGVAGFPGDWIDRVFLPFDTSVIPDGADINSAELHVYATVMQDEINDGNGWINIYEGSPATSTSLVDGDYDQCGSLNNPTSGTTNRDLGDTTGYPNISFSLNQTGLGWINTSGWTDLCLREGHDVTDTAPPGTPYWQESFLGLRTSEYPGTTYDPYLTITYIDPNSIPTAPTNLLTNNTTNPTGIFTAYPQFSSIFNDEATDAALDYRIQVSTISGNWSSPVWDSGTTSMATTTAGNRSPNITYGGDALPWDGEQYYWRMKFWDQYDNEGDWSTTTSSFTMNLDDVVSYQSKIESGSFYSYKNHSDRYWVVTDKTGTVYTFGKNTSARVESSDSTKIGKWMLEEIRDTNGNYITYEYTKDGNQVYPSKITYTGHDTTDGISTVIFTKETRTDISTSTRYGFEVVTKERIKEIKSEVNGSWVRKYALAYTTGDNGTRSLLDTVTETGRDESGGTIILPATDFDYQSGGDGWTEDTSWSIPLSFISSTGLASGVEMADVNGDALPDILSSKDGTQKVYIHNGTGWTLDTSWSIPTDFVDGNSKDLGIRLADVNGDSLVDIVQSRSYKMTESPWSLVEERKTYINNGSGWDYDSSWNLPNGLLFVNDNGADMGKRLMDVNGDGLPDIVGSTANVYINTGSNWAENSNWYFPYNFYGNGDLGVRIADVNGDGLPDVVKGYTGWTGYSACQMPVTNEVRINTGSGWTLDSSWTLPTVFIGRTLISSCANNNTRVYDKGLRIGDVNADGLPDLFEYKYGDGDTVYLNTGSGWSTDSAWDIPDAFTDVNNKDTGVRITDITGDGIPDFLISNSSGDTVYLGDTSKSDLLSVIHESTGGETRITYGGSAEGSLNPEAPFVVNTVNTITTDDGNGNISTTTSTYEGGEFSFVDAFDKRFAGFATTTQTTSEGYITKTFYHQGNGSQSSLGENSDHESKIGKAYRTEIYDDANNLYQTTITKWENYDLGNDNDYVKQTQTLTLQYDGDSDHKDTAQTFTYDNTTGNLTQSVEYGEVTGSDNGTFTDTGSDKYTTDITYAASTTLHIWKPQTETTKDQSSTKVKETKHYYDTLALGSITDGNETKTEFWKEGSTYIDTERTFNTYGLITQEKDARDKATNYTFDANNLYVATSTDAENLTTEFYYDLSSGQVTKTIDPNDNTFETTYDAFDRPKTVKQPDIDTPSTLVTTTSYIYTDALPRAMQETRHLDGSTSFDVYSYFDGFGRLIQTRKEAEDTNSFSVSDTTYNPRGLVETVSLPYFSTGSASTTATTTQALYTTSLYDPLDRPTTIDNIIGTTTHSYDQWEEILTDAEGNTKDLHTDAYGNLAKVGEHNGAKTYTTTYAWDYLQNLTTITDEEGNVRNFTYDALGRRKTAEDLHVSGDSTFGSYTYSYDNAGNLTSQTNPNGDIINYTYDDINRILTEDYTGDTGTEIIYAYDTCTEGAGKLCGATTTDISTNLIYNALGFVSEETKTIDSTDYVTSFDYDRAGNQTLITTPDNAETKYTFNTAGLLEKVETKESGGSFVDVMKNFNYGPHGKVTEKNFHNGATTTLTYDANALYRLTNILTTKPTAQLGASYKLLPFKPYSFDGYGNFGNRKIKTVKIAYDKKAPKHIVTAQERAQYNTLKTQGIIGKISKRGVPDYIPKVYGPSTKPARKPQSTTTTALILPDGKTQVTLADGSTGLLAGVNTPSAPQRMYSEGVWKSENILWNPSFETDTSSWQNWGGETGTGRDCTVSFDGSCSFKFVNDTAGNNWDAVLQQVYRIDWNVGYKLRFAAKAATTSTIDVSISQNHSPWYDYGLGTTVTLTDTWQVFELDMRSWGNDEDARVYFGLGANATTYSFDLIELVPDEKNLLGNPSFENDLNSWSFWSASSSNTTAIDCTDATVGPCSEKITQPNTTEFNWQVQLQQGLTVSQGTDYIVTFDARAETNRDVSMLYTLNHDPWTEITPQVTILLRLELFKT
jgi:YD repeat-containing protein